MKGTIELPVSSLVLLSPFAKACLWRNINQVVKACDPWFDKAVLHRFA